MNAKQLKFLQLFETFVKTDFLADKKLLLKSIKGFLDHDYLLAADVWDYIAATRESEMSGDKKIADIIGGDLLTAFYERAQAKCVKAVNDTLSLRKAIYQYSTRAGTAEAFAILTDLMVSSKIEACDEILKCLVKNDRISFGETMKRALEKVFIELLKKNPAKIEMNRKLSSLLLTYITKIKTDERAMLEQRLREIQ